MIFEPGKWDGDHWIGGEVPIGFSKKTIGFPRVAMNCALCHTTAVRGPGEVTPRDLPRRPVAAAQPAGLSPLPVRLRHDERFTPDILLEEMSYDVKLSPVEKALYRYVIIPQTRQGLFDLEKQYAWMANKPDWGTRPDRPVQPGEGQRAQDGARRHDRQRRHAASLEHESACRLRPPLGRHEHEHPRHRPELGDRRRLDPRLDRPGRPEAGRGLPPESLPAPKYPFAIDAAKAEKGRPIYEQKCAECHAFGGAQTGKIVRVDEVGTDGQRHRLWTDEAARRYNAFAVGYPWKFDGFHGTDGPDGGYVSVPLDGIWLRGPFLHNGSVPTLRDLLKPPDARRSNSGAAAIGTTRRAWASTRPPRRPGSSARSSTPRSRATATAGIPTAPTCPKIRRTLLVEYMKTL